MTFRRTSSPPPHGSSAAVELRRWRSRMARRRVRLRHNDRLFRDYDPGHHVRNQSQSAASEGEHQPDETNKSDIDVEVAREAHAHSGDLASFSSAFQRTARHASAQLTSTG